MPTSPPASAAAPRCRTTPVPRHGRDLPDSLVTPSLFSSFAHLLSRPPPHSIPCAHRPTPQTAGPTYSTAALLKRNNLKLSDIDIIEFHEAFAGQV